MYYEWHRTRLNTNNKTIFSLRWNRFTWQKQICKYHRTFGPSFVNYCSIYWLILLWHYILNMCKTSILDVECEYYYIFEFSYWWQVAYWTIDGFQYVLNSMICLSKWTPISVFKADILLMINYNETAKSDAFCLIVVNKSKMWVSLQVELNGLVKKQSTYVPYSIGNFSFSDALLTVFELRVSVL